MAVSLFALWHHSLRTYSRARRDATALCFKLLSILGTTSSSIRMADWVAPPVLKAVSHKTILMSMVLLFPKQNICLIITTSAREGCSFRPYLISCSHDSTCLPLPPFQRHLGISCKIPGCFDTPLVPPLLFLRSKDCSPLSNGHSFLFRSSETNLFFLFLPPPQLPPALYSPLTILCSSILCTSPLLPPRYRDAS